MTLDENIMNAVRVVEETHKNIDKLIKLLRNPDYVGKGKKYWAPMAEKFLRYNSDPDCNGWFYRSVIVLLQRAADDKSTTDKDWLNAPFYAIEINIVPKDTRVPKINVGRFEFINVENWKNNFSPADYWYFYEPMHCLERKGFYPIPLDDGIIKIARDDDKYGSKEFYYGLKSVYVTEHDLTKINKDNYTIIYDLIEKLARIP